MSEPRSPPLPYTPPYFPGELLSSWLRRIAAEYGVDLPHLARHIGLSGSRASQIDHELSADDLRRAATALGSKPAEIQAMVHVPRLKVLRPSSSLLQLCLGCRVGHRSVTHLPVAIRAWFEFWQIERGNCGIPFSPPGAARLDRVNPAREEPLWFESLRQAGRVGARRLADFARRPFTADWSPMTILRLLSMRFDAVQFACSPGQSHEAAELFTPRRLTELFIPGLADRWRGNFLPEPWTEDRPVRLVTARTILFAAVTAVLADRPAAVRLLEGAAPYVRHHEFQRLLLSLAMSAA